MPVPGRTKYQPLIAFLATQHERDLTLTFAEIEAIIGMPLSVSASNDCDVWHSTRQSHVRRWQEMGWRARFDRRNHCVHFMRDDEETADGRR